MDVQKSYFLPHIWSRCSRSMLNVPRWKGKYPRRGFGPCPKSWAPSPAVQTARCANSSYISIQIEYFVFAQHEKQTATTNPLTPTCSQAKATNKMHRKAESRCAVLKCILQSLLKWNSKLMNTGKWSTWLVHGGDVYLDIPSCSLRPHIRVLLKKKKQSWQICQCKW